MKNFRKILAVLAVLFVGVSYAQTAEEVQTKFNEAAIALNAKDFKKSAALFQEVVNMGATAEGDVADNVKQAKAYIISSYMNAGKTEASQKKFTEALVDFKAARDCANKFADIRNKQQAENFIGHVYKAWSAEKFKANDFNGAAEIALNAFQDNDKDYKNAIFAAQCYMKSGEKAKAEELIDKMIVLGDSNARYAAAKTEAIAAITNDKMAEAIEAIKAKDNAKALEAIEVAAKYSPNAPNVALARLQALTDLKQYSSVVKHVDGVAVQTSPLTKSNAAFLVAIAFQELKNNAKAIEYYKQVVEGPNAETAKKLAAELAKQPAA